MYTAGSWPFVWKVYADGTRLHVGLGKPWKRMGGVTMPMSQVTFGIIGKPFSIALWWGNKRIFWIGDWAWKRAMSRSA